jgi:hypothetical protein
MAVAMAIYAHSRIKKLKPDVMPKTYEHFAFYRSFYLASAGIAFAPVVVTINRGMHSTLSHANLGMVAIVICLCAASGFWALAELYGVHLFISKDSALCGESKGVGKHSTAVVCAPSSVVSGTGVVVFSIHPPHFFIAYTGMGGEKPMVRRGIAGGSGMFRYSVDNGRHAAL